MRYLFLLIMTLLLIGLVSATSDVAYIITGPFKANAVLIGMLDEMNLTHTNILASNVGSTNFSDYKFILVNNEIFSNPDEIPVNDYPTIMVDGDNIEDWGWVTSVTKTRQSVPLHFNLTDLNHPIARGFTYSDITAYTSREADLYSLRESNIFSGLTIVASTIQNSGDAVIVLSRAGTNLTHASEPDTEINANSVFFGIPTTQYWTNDTKQLFKNAISYVLGETSFNLSLKSGNNLVSIPILLKSEDINQILSNPNVISIKEYSGSLVDAENLNNNKGYFIKTSGDTSITIEGFTPSRLQTVYLENGMNLVGITSMNNISLSSLPSGIIEVSSRKINGTYNIATKYPTPIGWYNPSNIVLEPGKGYWIKTNQPVTWSYIP